ncbi:MAG: extracellular solute-binding protein [Paracoccaceae bacterium]
MSVNRRTFIATSTAAAALLPYAGRAQGSLEELYEAARSEGELTWYIVPYGSETAERIGAAFTKKYPGVKVNVVRTTAQVAFQRLNQDIDSGVANCDVFASSVMAHAVDLKERGLLMNYTPINKENAFPDFRNIDPDDAFTVTTAGPMCIVYNTDKVTEEEAPKNWPDLLDPKWKSQVAIGHPGFSGYVGLWAVKMRELYGWDFFEKMAEQDPHIGRSSIDVVTTTASGETAVGAGPSASSLISAEKGNPIANIYPTDGTVVITSPSAIMGDAPHPSAAKLFMEFQLSQECGQVVADEFSTPVVPGVALRDGVKPLGDIKVIQATLDQMTKSVPEVAEQFRDTFGI